jgi:hypothetical protein
MPILSLSDTNAAYDAGRVHVQRFYKGANSTIKDGFWQDWSFAAGQPAYDARIGVSGAFNPYIASKNDAIYFPGINPGEDRRLKRVVLRTQASGASQASLNVMVYDLLGVYPLIDGDSTDVQYFDNTLTLPRYVDGNGVFPVLVNHIAPITSTGDGVMTFLDTNNVERTVNFGVAFGTAGNVVSAVTNSAVAGSQGGISMPTQDSAGVKAITSIQFINPPSGLLCIYMVRPLVTIANNDGALLADKVATEKFLAMQNGWHYPKIEDGAWLGMFTMPNGGNRTVASMYGYFEFIWG